MKDLPDGVRIKDVAIREQAGVRKTILTIELQVTLEQLSVEVQKVEKGIAYTKYGEELEGLRTELAAAKASEAAMQERLTKVGTMQLVQMSDLWTEKEAALTKLREAEAKISLLQEVVRSCEWGGPTFQCPICGSTPSMGHSLMCGVLKALA